MIFAVVFSLFFLVMMLFASKLAAGIIEGCAEREGYQEAYDHVAFVLAQNEMLI